MSSIHYYSLFVINAPYLCNVFFSLWRNISSEHTNDRISPSSQLRNARACISALDAPQVLFKTRGIIKQAKLIVTVYYTTAKLETVPS